MRRKLIIGLIALILSVGCSTMKDLKSKAEQKWDKYQAEKAAKILQLCENDQKCVQAVNNEQILIGMPEKALYESIGEPDKVNRSVYASGIHKQCIYGDIKDRKYVYIENGYVTSWSD